MRWFGLALLLMLSMGSAALFAGFVRIPPDYNPWAPLDVRAKPNIVTHLKLLRLSDDATLCQETLATTMLDYVPLDDKPEGACPLVDTVQVRSSDIEFSNSFMATCPLAVAWKVFEHTTLQQAAQKHFGQNIREVRHVGSFACRNVYGRQEGRRSEHARANALDVTGFVLEDGTSISVERDWGSTKQPARSAFLRDVRDGACGAFRVVLGPEYNEAHANHFHLDMGMYKICR